MRVCGLGDGRAAPFQEEHIAPRAVVAAKALAGTNDHAAGHAFVKRFRSVPPAGIEPATRGLGNRCSIP